MSDRSGHGRRRFSLVGRTARRGVYGARAAVARAPLRVRLVVTSVLLVIAALVGAGGIALATLQSYLTNRVDDQLRSVSTSVAEHQVNGLITTPAGTNPGGRGGRGGGGNDNDGDSRDASSLPSAYVIAVFGADGQKLYERSNLVDSGEALPRFPPFEADDLATGQTKLFDVPSTKGDQDWRVLATSVSLTAGPRGTLLIAQSLGDVQNTVERLTVLLLVIGAGAVVVLAAAGYMTVRVSLRPLRDVERSAARIAAGDLSHRVPASDPHTEVGQLAAALNKMLSDIEAAFAARAASEAAARSSEQKMRVSENAARHSEERMRRFVADASHELRTPLTSIRGFAELYRQGAAHEPPDVERLMAHIESEAARMGLLVEDLLLLARLDQERPLERKPVDLLAVVTDSLRAARATDPARPIEFVLDSPDQPAMVIGDEPRLRQVFANLLTNALKHTPPSTPVTVTLSSRGDGPHAGRVVVEVADDGPGMTADSASRVFERFYRADASRNRADGGTGLGLAIVAALVAGHDGTVDVVTAPGEGARFVVSLPFASLPS